MTVQLALRHPIDHRRSSPGDERPFLTMFPMPDKNTLFYGDNLDVLPRVDPSSVDLIYLDPPFNSNATYNVLFKSLKGDPASAQIHAFGDAWKWSIEAESTYESFTSGFSPTPVVVFLRAMFQVLGKSDMMAYLVMMAPRLVEIRRVLKPSGLMYLHCDPTAGHYLKLLADSVFGPDNLRNEIIWYYNSGARKKSDFGKRHDLIFRYSKSDDYYFDDNAVREPYSPDINIPKSKAHYYDPRGKVMDDVWRIPIIPQNDKKERLGYPTQKPIALLKRIIESSCPADGVVLDPFCGCGTAVDAAQELNRQWIGIDITYIAVDLIINRLKGRYGTDAQFQVDGIPQDVEGANALSDRNKIDFERWAVSLVHGQPTKASGDEGIDGRVYFARTYKEPLDAGVCAVSVKAGETVNPGMVRDLAGTVSGSDSQMGLLLTRITPTAGMVTEAAKHGSYIHDATGTLYPKIQMMTVTELLDGKQPKIPSPLPPYQQASWAATSVAVPLF